MGRGDVIETGVDRLISLVQKKKRISVAEAAKELSVPSEVIDEWASFLDEEGALSIEYSFTTPYLVERKVSKEEIHRKTQELSVKKEYFVRKAESILESIEQQHESIEKIKEDFQTLKDALGSHTKTLEKEFRELSSFDAAKREIERRIIKHEEAFHRQLQSQSKVITNERKKYEHLLEELKEQKRNIVQGQEQVMSLRQRESQVMRQLTQLDKVIQDLRKRVIDQDNYILTTEASLRRLMTTSTSIAQDIYSRRKKMSQLMDAGKKHQEDLIAKQKDIVEKMLKKGSRLTQQTQSQSKSVKKLERFFARKHKVEKLIAEINSDHNKLRQDLIYLIKKARVVNLYRKQGKDQKGIQEIKSAFSSIESRKKQLERKLVDLGKGLSLLSKKR